MSFFDIGFHGDRYLLKLVDHLLRGPATRFVETGTNVGSTLAYVARTYPSIPCWSCEPNAPACEQARTNIGPCDHVRLFSESSQSFMQRLDREPVFDKTNTLFWLDAHGQGFAWPLREEIAWITGTFRSSYVLIDDFRIPGRPEFGFDTYDGQECSLDYIGPFLAHRERLRLHLPTYSEKTSQHHPLRGWALLTIDGPAQFPPPLSDFIVESPLPEA
jgi:hypothetical protein